MQTRCPQPTHVNMLPSSPLRWICPEPQFALHHRKLESSPSAARVAKLSYFSNTSVVAYCWTSLCSSKILHSDPGHLMLLHPLFSNSVAIQEAKQLGQVSGSCSQL